MQLLGRMTPRAHLSKQFTTEIRIVSANLRGFHTNVGELTHRCVVKTKADIVFVSETFLDERIPWNYAKIPGYSAWIRRDRSTLGGGVALCHKETLHLQIIETPIPDGLEIIIFKIIDAHGQGTLCCGCYRPPSQGTALFDFLMDNLDQLMMEHKCEHVVILGDLNQHIVQATFDNLLAVFDLTNHVRFATHSSGSSLDPVVTDFPTPTVSCSPLGFVGTSDHEAVLTKIEFKKPQDEQYTRTLWKWEQAQWRELKLALKETEWDSELHGDVNQQVERLTEILLKLQSKWVPHMDYKTKVSDQPWFGPQCRAASDAKYNAWRNLKRNPTQRNKTLHRQAAVHMSNTHRWAVHQWEMDTKNKLKHGQAGSKLWWKLAKEKQGATRDGVIPPLISPEGKVALKTQDKVDLLARHFANKMTVPNPELTPPSLPILTSEMLSSLKTSHFELERLLREVKETKAMGPDLISPRLLRRCSKELAQPLASIFNHCFDTQKWPDLWKKSWVVPVHKKDSKSEVKNYRPVALLSAISKVFEKIIAERITEHLTKRHLLCARQFGFRKEHSAADLHLLMSSSWSAALDRGQRTLVVALDIEGAFDRVWHKALIGKTRALGVDGKLLALLQDYLHNRNMSVVLDGKESTPQKIMAGVPQGSVLGPLLWNIFINDLLNLIPESKAFADDITLSQSYEPENEASAVLKANSRLNNIISWGRRWQVKFAPHKTHLMLISRSQSNISLNFDSRQVNSEDEVEILGVIYDKTLSYKSHIEKVARTASGKLAMLRRISWLLDQQGRETLYKAQVRSLLEYSPLTWGGAAAKHLALLDQVQRRARRIIEDSVPRVASNLQNLQQRRDVAGLTTMFKIQQMNTVHLQPLRQPARQVQRTTRTVVQTPEALAEPRCRTQHQQRQFIPKYVRMWNNYLTIHPNIARHKLQSFKCHVNDWVRMF